MLIFREDGEHIIWMYIAPVIWGTMSINFVYGHSVATDFGGIDKSDCMHQKAHDLAPNIFLQIFFETLKKRHMFYLILNPHLPIRFSKLPS